MKRADKINRFSIRKSTLGVISATVSSLILFNGYTVSADGVQNTQHSGTIAVQNQGNNEQTDSVASSTIFEGEEFIATETPKEDNAATESNITWEQFAQENNVKNGDREGTLGDNGTTSQQFLAEQESRHSEDKYENPESFKVDDNWYRGIHRIITNQDDLNNYLATTGDEWNSDQVIFRNDEDIIFPTGTYTLSASAKWWLMPESSGNIDLGNSTVAIYDRSNSGNSSFKIFFTGDQGGRVVKNGSFVGTVEFKEDSDGNIAMAGNRPDKSGTKTSVVAISSVKGSNITFDNLEFNNAQAVSEHIFDLMGVDNVTISNSTFAGYFGKATDAQIQNLVTDINRSHLIYSEAIQVDTASYDGIGFSASRFETLKNSKNEPEKFEVKYFSSSDFDGRASTNVTIDNNSFIPYEGPSGYAIATGNLDNVVSDRSQGVGSHSLTYLLSDQGLQNNKLSATSRETLNQYENIKITNNVFEKTSYLTADKIKSLINNESGKLYLLNILAPIHMMGGENDQTVPGFYNQPKEKQLEQFESVGRNNYIVSGNEFINQKYDFLNYINGKYVVPDANSNAISDELKVAITNRVGWFESKNKTRFVDENNVELSISKEEILNPIEISGYSYSKSYRKAVETTEGSVEVTHVYVKNDYKTVNEYRQTEEGVDEFAVTYFNGQKQSEVFVQSHTNKATVKETRAFATRFESDNTKEYGTPNEEIQAGQDQVIIKVIGVTYSVNAKGELVTEVHNEQDIPSKDRIIKVGTKPSAKTEPIAFNTTYLADETLTAGQQVTTVSGEAGERVIETTYTLDVQKSQLTGTAQVIETVQAARTVKEPVTAIVKVGTKPETATEAIDFTTTYEADETLETGQQQSVTEGQKGVKTVTTTYSVNADGTVTPKVSEAVTTKEAISALIKIGTKPSTSLIPIDFTTTYEADETLEVGQTKLKVSGVDGEAEVTTSYRLDPLTGQVTSYVSRSLAKKAPVGQVVVVGTKPTKAIQSVPFSTIEEVDGSLDSGLRKVKVVGVDGEAEITTPYSLDAMTGQVVAGSPTTVTIKEPIAEVVLVGSKPLPVAPSSDSKSSVLTATKKSNDGLNVTSSSAGSPTNASNSTAKATLPNTGDKETATAVLGAAALLVAVGLTSLKKRED